MQDASSFSRVFSIAAATTVGALTLLVGSFTGCSKESPKNDVAPHASSAPPATAAASSAAPASSSATPFVNALPVPAASVAAMVNPAGLAPYSGPTGSVEGTVYVDGDPAPDSDDQDFNACLAAVGMYKKKFREGAATGPNGARVVADALVGVTGYNAFVPEKSESKKVVFNDCSYGTRTVAMTFGQRLEVANKSDRAIAPGFDQTFAPALMIAPPKESGDPVKLYAERPGFFTMSDRLGPKHRVLDVYVLLFPTHAVSDVAGHYRIDGIPAGKVDVFARLRAIGQEASDKVEVRDGVVQKVDLVLHFNAKTAPKIDAGPRQKPIP